ncbi:unnamed protein product [Owenia fusiformis]|uniref:Uncharacterized protein n=1 Tax=Owenia fusiformis TaxID=6347 RepID=A0A8S4N4E7_OWEFU|nr:unnamed protein product [Owenia fusiformis]
MASAGTSRTIRSAPSTANGKRANHQNTSTLIITGKERDTLTPMRSMRPNATPGGVEAEKPILSAHHKIPLEPTYKLEPDNDKRFPLTEVKQVIKDVFTTELDGVKYNAETSNVKAKELADIIKHKVKQLRKTRYKTIVLVYLGQNEMDFKASIALTSRSLWNDKLDSFVEHSHKTNSLYVVGLVYGLYAE